MDGGQAFLLQRMQFVQFWLVFYVELFQILNTNRTKIENWTGFCANVVENIEPWPKNSLRRAQPSFARGFWALINQNLQRIRSTNPSSLWDIAQDPFQFPWFRFLVETFSQKIDTLWKSGEIKGQFGQFSSLFQVFWRGRTRILIFQDFSICFVLKKMSLWTVSWFLFHKCLFTLYIFPGRWNVDIIKIFSHIYTITREQLRQIL